MSLRVMKECGSALMALASFEGTASHSRSHSYPLHPTAAALAVAGEFALQARCDAQIGSALEAVHLYFC